MNFSCARHEIRDLCMSMNSMEIPHNCPPKDAFRYEEIEEINEKWEELYCRLRRLQDMWFEKKSNKIIVN